MKKIHLKLRDSPERHTKHTEKQNTIILKTVLKRIENVVLVREEIICSPVPKSKVKNSENLIKLKS